MINKCPECEAEPRIADNTLKGEILKCPSCGAELEIRNVRVDAVTGKTLFLLELAPPEGEDWGE